MPRERTLQYPSIAEKGTFLTIRLLSAQKIKLGELATELNRSQSELVREAIMALLGVYYGERSKDALAKTVDEGVARGKH